MTSLTFLRHCHRYNVTDSGHCRPTLVSWSVGSGLRTRLVQHSPQPKGDRIRLLPRHIWSAEPRTPTSTGAAPPQTTLTYEVQAVVNGKASAGNPTAVTTMTHRASGWLTSTRPTKY